MASFAGLLLHMSKSALVGPLGSMAMRCIDDRVDELGNVQIEGIDDNDRGWHEAVTGRSQEAWLLKQLFVERRFGRRNKRYSLKRRR